jgi:hypothetical protein
VIVPIVVVFEVPVKSTVSVWTDDDVSPDADMARPKFAVLGPAVFAATVKVKDPVLDPAGMVTVGGSLVKVIPVPMDE